MPPHTGSFTFKPIQAPIEDRGPLQTQSRTGSAGAPSNPSGEEGAPAAPALPPEAGRRGPDGQAGAPGSSSGDRTSWESSRSPSGACSRKEPDSDALL